MIPLLIELGLALAGGIAQKVSADKQHEKDLSKFNSDSVRDIMDKRASRAGDSMYMQSALSRQEHKPEAPPSPMPGVVAGMGGALLGYNGGSSGAAAGGALESALGASGWKNPAVQGDRAGYQAAISGEGGAQTERQGYEAAKGGGGGGGGVGGVSQALAQQPAATTPDYKDLNNWIDDKASLANIKPEYDYEEDYLKPSRELWAAQRARGY